MPKYVIERDIPAIGSATAEQLQSAAQLSCDVLRKLGPEIQWVHSYVTCNKIYCVYIAPSEELIREHARLTGLPCNQVSVVSMVIDPVSAEAEPKAKHSVA